MEISARLIEEYRTALAVGTVQASPQERELYALHEDALAQLVAAASREGATKEEILALLQIERRAFGWSYLSGEAGAHTEASFQALFASIDGVANA
jgi:hypothetical protein